MSFSFLIRFQEQASAYLGVAALGTQTSTRHLRETADADPQRSDFDAVPRAVRASLTKTQTFQQSEHSDTDPDTKPRYRAIPYAADPNK